MSGLSDNTPPLEERQALYQLVVARSDIMEALTACRYIFANVKDMTHELWVPMQDVEE